MTLSKEAMAKIAKQAVAEIGKNNGFDPNEYTRLPKPGPGSRLYGLSRTTLLEIGEQCPGLLLRLRQKDAERGITLLHIPTLRAYLQGLREEGSKLAITKQ